MSDQLPPRWVEQYLEIPFKDRGFDHDGCHCWGLVWLVYKNELGIELPKHLEFSANDVRHIHKAVKEAKSVDPWIPIVGRRQMYDLLVMYVFKDKHDQEAEPQGGTLQCHIGVMVSPNHVLHVEEGDCSSCPSVDNLWIKRRIVGTYRHKDLYQNIAMNGVSL